jgi:hypothetical protein
MHKDNLLQNLIFINLRYLLLYVIGFCYFSNYSPLLAHCADADMDFTSEKKIDPEFKALVENICDLLLHEHSADEIIEMLNDNQENPYDIQKLVSHIQHLLNNQNPKSNIISIIVTNNESEEYYARKNFLTKMKASYFVFKMAVIFVAVVVIYYLLCLLFGKFNIKLPLSGLLSWLFGLIPGFPKPIPPVDEKNNEKPSNSELQHDDETPKSFDEQEDPSSHLSTLGIQGAPRRIRVRFHPPKARFNQKLYEETAELSTKLMKSMGLDPAAIQSDVEAEKIMPSIPQNRIPEDNRRVSEQIDELIGICKKLSADAGINV